MKRLLALLLVLMLSVSFSAVADSYKDMTDEELTELFLDVKEEMIKRGAWEGVTLPAGVYYVGMGFPEGTYECTNVWGGGAALMYKNYQSYLNGDTYLTRAWVISGQSFNMALYGDVCFVLEFNSIMKPFSFPIMGS